MPGHIGLEEAEPGPGEESFHGCPQRLQAGPVPIDGDEVDVRSGDITLGERERSSAGAEVGPDTAAVPVDPLLDQLHVVGVVHRTTPLEEVDTYSFPPSPLSRQGPGPSRVLVVGSPPFAS